MAIYIDTKEVVPYHCSKFCRNFDASTKYSQKELQAGVECDDANCSGVYEASVVYCDDLSKFFGPRSR